ncbi:unnamed protein product [Ambrosiozyma monospora]|uniref:Unnamed protein product n=1 Tax=Ambrosiozyma monospora TaxID=43982 RepID=A0A9W6Z4B9_AMBMO|nr:unnamed protein product [Ambrosiozyma monospora]
MSLVSQQQLLQNQLRLKQLDEQRLKQFEQTKSFQSSNTQEVLQNLRKREAEKMVPTPQKDPTDPTSVLMPTSANPTEVLASRFNSWRNIIGCLIHYLKEIVSVHEEISRQQIRLHHAITFPFITQGLDGDYYQPIRLNNSSGSGGGASNLFHHNNNDAGASGAGSGAGGNVASDLARQNDDFEMARKFFLPLGSGSVQDLPTLLYQYHSRAAQLAQTTVKELNQTIIPRLEDLKRDLLVKIKEIRTLQSDFKTQIGTLQHQTKSSLSAYALAIDMAKKNPSHLDPKQDPHILKYVLDRQIKKQLTEENYLHEAFINLQTSGKELEKLKMFLIN